MKRKKPEPQLYHLARSLSLVIEDERDLGEAIAYVVLDSLLDFSSVSGSSEERQFEQVKAVHQGLEAMVSLVQQEGLYHPLSRLQQNVGSRFNEYSQNNSTAIGQSEIIQGAFDRLSGRFARNYEDRLRRDGLELYHLVLGRREVSGRKNILMIDYSNIWEAFVEASR